MPTYQEDALAYAQLIGESLRDRGLSGNALIELKKLTRSNEYLASQVYDYALRENLQGSELGYMYFALVEIWDHAVYGTANEEDHEELKERLRDLRRTR